MNMLLLRASLMEILRPACVHPDQLRMLVDFTPTLWSVQVTPARADLPRLIGAAGVNFKAVKTMLEHAGRVHRVETRFFVKDPEPQNRERIIPQGTAPNPQWDGSEAIQAIEAALSMAGYPREVRKVITEGGRLRLVVVPPIPMPLGGALSRWSHVIARSCGSGCDLDFQGA